MNRDGFMSVTIKDIAKAANVSYATVSRALSDHPDISEETKKKIKKLAKDMGYTPNIVARSLITKATKTIGLIIPDITNPFFPEVAQGVEGYAYDNGYTVLLCTTNWQIEREERYLKALRSKMVDGIIIAPAIDDISHIICHFNGGDTPVVFVTYSPDNPDCSFVATDDYKCGFMATEYLLKLGHRNIAYIGGLENSSSDRRRFEGHREALKSYGLPLRYSPMHGQFKQMSGYELTKELLIYNDIPTAILAGNDVLALGVIQAVEEFGLKVPDNVSVMGIDDISFASFDKISLTTVAQPKGEIGRLAAEIIIQKINNPQDKAPVKKVLEPRLIIRRTCRSI
ncbi:LacI family DNA-binding transcriptional regulator [Mahella sp.]|uniref:LacI family DNA-binding transcriptional regulator n=1 Tax=Mahella sp. TaxID=2798721 RepID=UPI0025C01A8B|nr:LacI family DNA-binding transcriptional regulator [Mahella sp.]MBZ4666216.1 transcriptional regulator, LacI family [Mahella sp.]